MVLDAALPPCSLREVPPLARAAEELGLGCLWSTETQHDPFLPGPLVFEHTRRLAFGTAVAIAFARSPATLAYTAWDLAQAGGGRFVLGLGTQVRAHVERRFGMPWPDSVVGKLREQVLAVRAFWRCWQTGEPLRFEGRYYRLNLMSPFFNPGPVDHPEIPIYLAGVNTGLARLAGELAQGFHVHPLHSPEYLRQVVLPALEAGAARAGRRPSEVSVTANVFVATTDADVQFVRSQIAFYASTPSYRPVFTLHGWEDVARRLSELASARRWDAMAQLVTDDMVAAFAVVADRNTLPDALRARYSGLAHRLVPYLPFDPASRGELWAHVASRFR
ncbi:MAG: TIGR03617 family F420-dependent LLM class oxidoreductase [Armatimonadota bacterium]|nr:TIGR03617 family F420-dependent LLM class oxidoreductase [Armatimonadota bacterium]MDW8155222.1 TIGR03617 family F420-dependent LLM class oxidoreductase [Armatimonadota bacterium]